MLELKRQLLHMRHTADNEEASVGGRTRRGAWQQQEQQRPSAKAAAAFAVNNSTPLAIVWVLFAVPAAAATFLDQGLMTA